MTKKQQRTAQVIAKYRGLPGEFYMLKGLLCMDHAFDCTGADHRLINGVFDFVMIAQRMDQLNELAVQS